MSQPTLEPKWLFGVPPVLDNTTHFQKGCLHFQTISECFRKALEWPSRFGLTDFHWLCRCRPEYFSLGCASTLTHSRPPQYIVNNGTESTSARLDVFFFGVGFGFGRSLLGASSPLVIDFQFPNKRDAQLERPPYFIRV